VLGSDGRTASDAFASPQAILDFYFSRQTQATRLLNEVKMILVGRGGAGKTSTVQALMGEEFREGEESTPGIALCDWVMDGCQGEPVTAHVWDFAGQVITHALHQFFFSVRSIYVVVLTGRENSEREDAEYWLRLIKAFGTDDKGVGPPVLVALNKWELPGCRPRLDCAALKERYPFIRGFVELDCKSGRGVDELRGALCREVEAMAWVREPFAVSWDDVRRALAGEDGREKRAHIPYAEYRLLCADRGVTDEGHQDSLAEILHNLGAALNYRNDPRLREATVLQPEWLTNHVYQLMRRAEAQEGLLKQADLPVVLKDEPDEKMRAYLVQLMERFEIAYPQKPQDTRLWLVPQALPDNQPAEAAVLAGTADATRLRYTYPALPEGLVARAIVRLHELIEEADGHRQQWASGAILARDGARALLRKEPQDRVVMVTVTGPAEARQALAGLCQAVMRDIHKDIPGLDPVEETLVEGIWVETVTLEVDERNARPTGINTRDRGTVMIDPEATNNAFTKKPARQEEVWKPSVFISYSKKDVNQRKRLELDLIVLENAGLLAGAWHDRMIDPGDRWDDVIQRELAAADVVIILVSAAALATKYIMQHELPYALATHAVVVPLILEECQWHLTALKPLQGLPEKGVPINKWNPRAGGWKSVATGLEQCFRKLIDARGALA
jgi:internalin A